MSRGSTVILERRFVPKGTLIMEEGEPGNCAYLIQSGVVEVFTQNEGRELRLAKLDLGQIFGEMALIFDELRTASVRALEDCNLIVITRQSFQAKLGKTDPTIAAIVKMLTQRVISANN
ncbi:MAG: cyclic nucleotide-binding domain-containing protein, partial [Rhodospirillales bacterium]|nr:cyclic nucleotide-binding domain-containing protein [Rhodospirillales bacterium]